MAVDPAFAHSSMFLRQLVRPHAVREGKVGLEYWERPSLTVGLWLFAILAPRLLNASSSFLVDSLSDYLPFAGWVGDFCYHGSWVWSLEKCARLVALVQQHKSSLVAGKGFKSPRCKTLRC